MPLPADSLSTLEAVCDAILPPGPSSWRDEVASRIAAAVDGSASAGDRAQFIRLLRLLDTPAAMLLAAGRWTRLAALARPAREAALRRLAQHPLPSVRGAFQALERLAVTVYYGDSDDAGRNPAWAAVGYPGPLPFVAAAPSPIVPVTLRSGATLQCDVVVVGSGAGGGVVAGELAAAGWNVIVIERGPLADPPTFTHREIGTLRRLYLDGGMRTTSDRGVTILAGSCVGGGTVVNYTTSLRLPDEVRAVWARVSGLDWFVGDAFDTSLDAVCRRLGVNVEHNHPSRRDEIMARGLRALGWHLEPTPRNVAGCGQDDLCGYCGFGCVRGAKQSMLATYLADAWTNGARFLVDCTAERVLIEDGRARGVAVRTKEGHAATVRARVVVAAAGAIHTPALLLRSGVRGGLIGRRIYLHPVAALWGRFDEDVQPWTGTIQAIYSDALARQHDGYGVRFETAPIHPALFALALPWAGAAEFGAAMALLPRTSLVGVLLRDRVGGRVTIDRHGAPVVRYRLSPYDRGHLRCGLEGAARVLLAAGARGVTTSQWRRVELEPHQAIESWLDAVDQAGYGPHDMMLASFHQMGTCPMGRNPRSSVVDATGECHALRDLYVADASLFPTASGVNPMITIGGLAHHIAQQINARAR
jgi:choline dehydrogenase-like flavoprotein